jgi:hypothetical protein
MVLVTPYCKEKYFFTKGGSEFWIPLEKEIRIDFAIVWTRTVVFNSAFRFRLVTAPSYLLVTLIRVSITWGVTHHHNIHSHLLWTLIAPCSRERIWPPVIPIWIRLHVLWFEVKTTPSSTSSPPTQTRRPSSPPPASSSSTSQASTSPSMCPPAPTSVSPTPRRSAATVGCPWAHHQTLLHRALPRWPHLCRPPRLLHSPTHHCGTTTSSYYWRS